MVIVVVSIKVKRASLFLRYNHGRSPHSWRSPITQFQLHHPLSDQRQSVSNSGLDLCVDALELDRTGGLNRESEMGIEIDPATGRSKPRIVCAANRMTYRDQSGETKTIIVAGARHHDGIMNPVIKQLLQQDSDRLIVHQEQGFIDQHGKFYSRLQAWLIAEENGQIRRRVGGDGFLGGLYSENLY